jgi:hypothetical protein
MLKFKIDGKPYEVPSYIPIGTYSKIYKIKGLFDQDYFDAKLISIVSDVPLEDLLDCPYDDIQYISTYILTTFPTPDDIEFVDRFELNGIEYGFFNNWRDITFAEYIDMDTISTKKPEELLNMLHILASIMYRPIVKETSKHNFEIEKYDVNTIPIRSELFKKELDIKYILGAQFFFIKFAKKFSNYTLPYSATKKIGMWTQIKLIWIMWRMIFQITSKKRSGGFLSSTKLLTTILLNMTTSTTKK